MTEIELKNAATLYLALKSGNWEITKMQPYPEFTDETNARLELEWKVTRKMPPFCCNNGEFRGIQFWIGASVIDALSKANTQLKSNGFEIETELKDYLI